MQLFFEAGETGRRIHFPRTGAMEPVALDFLQPRVTGSVIAKCMGSAFGFRMAKDTFVDPGDETAPQRRRCHLFRGLAH